MFVLDLKRYFSFVTYYIESYYNNRMTYFAMGV